MKGISRSSAGTKLARQIWMTRFEMELIVANPEAAATIDWKAVGLLCDADYSTEAGALQYLKMLEAA
jgi:hypothetical protein